MIRATLDEKKTMIRASTRALGGAIAAPITGTAVQSQHAIDCAGMSLIQVVQLTHQREGDPYTVLKG